MKSLFKCIVLLLFLTHSSYAAPDFLTISDIHYGSDNVSDDGEDTGPDLFRITMDKFSQLSKKVDFILCLGDLPTHSLFNVAKKEAYEQRVFDSLYANDTGLKPLFYIAGNNDSLSGNYQPFESKGITPLNFATHWSGACTHCKGLIIDKSHMYHDGYYSSYVIPGNTDVILIALNATQWTKTPLLSRYPNQERDALLQLSWLDKQLETHHASQLLIAMHEAPGNAYNGKPIWHKRYLDDFIKIVNSHRKSYGEITLLTSHSHMDELRKINLPNGSTLYAYSTPGISRIHHNYPGMKIFNLNKKMQISNFTTYYTNQTNQWGTQQYQAKGNSEAIFPGCKEATLHQCLNKMNDTQICHLIDQGLFYGVKSPTASNNSCTTIIKVN